MILENETESTRLDSHDFTYSNGSYTYHDTYVVGVFTWSQGYEQIYCNNEKVYECYFHGGLMK
jgi:hypothetical protein